MSQVPHESIGGCNKLSISNCLVDNSTSSILNKALINYKAVTSVASNTTIPKPLVINHHSSSTSTTSLSREGLIAVQGLDKVDNWNESHYILSNLSPQSILTSIISSNSVKNKSLVEQQQNITRQQNNQNLAAALASTANALAANTLNKTSTKTSNKLNIQNNVPKSFNANPIQSKSEVPNQASGFVTTRLVDLGKRLLEASRNGQTEHVRHLVVNLGAPFTSDWLGTTALHLAAQNGHHEIAEILLKGGLNRESRTKLERTALHGAAQGGWIKVVELLISQGSEVNSRDMLKMTPLHWAIEREHVVVAERLLLAGADIQIKSKFQLSPLDMALASNSFEIQQLFKGYLAKHQSLSLYGEFTTSFYESHAIVDTDVDCLLSHLETRDCTSPRHPHHLYHTNNNSRCIDLVELEWNNIKLENFLTTTTASTMVSDSDDSAEPKVEYLMKVVEELQKENQQLRQRVELLTTTRKRNFL